MLFYEKNWELCFKKTHQNGTTWCWILIVLQWLWNSFHFTTVDEFKLFLFHQILKIKTSKNWRFWKYFSKRKDLKINFKIFQIENFLLKITKIIFSFLFQWENENNLIFQWKDKFPEILRKHSLSFWKPQNLRNRKERLFCFIVDNKNHFLLKRKFVCCEIMNWIKLFNFKFNRIFLSFSCFHSTKMFSFP